MFRKGLVALLLLGVNLRCPCGAAAYKPDDGTDGYTPYFYKMDVPVRVRNSISYGRAWQLLRSRGAGSNITGPCDPPQLASSCNCSTGQAQPPNVGIADDHDTAAMPHCLPSSLCQTDDPPPQPDATRAPAGKVAILLFMDMQRQNMRFPIGTCVACLRRGYGKAVRELIRVLLSLAAVGTRLPVHVLASGERYPEVEAKLASRFGVSFIDTAVPPATVPGWGSKWARGSFAKLRALALTQYTKLIVLDNDDVVLRNMDHLAHAPAPGFVFGWKCYPRRELRASTMVLEPQASAWQRASELLGLESTAVYDDLGEQSVWRRLYKVVYELPAGFAAMRTADLPAAEWPKVHVVHDAHLIHDVQRAGWHAAGMTARVDRPNLEANRIFKEHFASHFADPPKPSKGRGGNSRAKGRRRERAARSRRTS